MDEDTPKTQPVHEVGMPLDTLSIAELQERITLLSAEIKRLHEAIATKSASRDAAESVFKI